MPDKMKGLGSARLYELDESGKVRSVQWIPFDYGFRASDIDCPMCGRKMVYISPPKTLANPPLKKKVICRWCGYAEYRIL